MIHIIVDTWDIISLQKLRNKSKEWITFLIFRSMGRYDSHCGDFVKCQELLWVVMNFLYAKKHMWRWYKNVWSIFMYSQSVKIIEVLSYLFFPKQNDIETIKGHCYHYFFFSNYIYFYSLYFLIILNKFRKNNFLIFENRICHKKVK